MDAPGVPDAMRAPLVATALELLGIPSPIGEERAICDHLEARLSRTLGPGAVLRFRDSLVLTPGPRRAERPTVALAGHLDTVPGETRTPVGSDGERLYGRGASDMKAGVAVIVELLERLDHATLGVNLTGLLYEREEGPYEENGLQPMLEELDALREIDLAFCLEPSDNRLQLGSLGGIHCTLVFSGERAHSARPWQGENAVHKAGPLLAALAGRERRAVEIGELTFYEVMSVTMVEATGTRNVVPDRFALNLNYRFAPTRTLEQAKADVLELCGGRCEVIWTDLSPPGPVCLDNPLLADLLADPTLPREPKQAWTDVARFGLFGVDALNLGPGEAAAAHAADESCRIALLVEGYRRFERYLEGLKPQG